MTSLVPELDAAGKLHFVLCDYGRRGKAFVETDPARADRETVVEDILSGEPPEPLRVIALRTDGPWHGVSAEIALEVVKRATVAGDSGLEPFPQGRLRELARLGHLGFTSIRGSTRANS